MFPIELFTFFYFSIFQCYHVLIKRSTLLFGSLEFLYQTADRIRLRTRYPCHQLSKSTKMTFYLNQKSSNFAKHVSTFFILFNRYRFQAYVLSYTVFYVLWNPLNLPTWETFLINLLFKTRRNERLPVMKHISKILTAHSCS